MPNSSVPTVKAGLLATIQASAGLAALNAAEAITWAHPGKHIQKEAIFLGDAAFSGERSSIGQVSHYEDYTIPVWVSVLGEGDAARTTEERLWTLVGYVEAAVRADGTLGAVTGLLSAVVLGKEPRNFIDPLGRVSECKITVVCRAKI